jgi:Delta3,5-Delta2,4-dienoyl-CoA isomerase
MLNAAFEMAEQIAVKSPVAVQLTKRALVHARNHSTQEGLDFIVSFLWLFFDDLNNDELILQRHWNMAMLQSEDFINATTALATKNPPPEFAKL